MLRQFTAQDADLLTELDSDPAVMRFLTGGEGTLPPEHYRERGLAATSSPAISGRTVTSGCSRHTRRSTAPSSAGSICARAHGPLDEAELGYRLRQAAWGKGYATEGSRALLAKGFTELGVRRVWADTMALNDRSRKVMAKVGMTMTGTPKPRPTC